MTARRVIDGDRGQRRFTAQPGMGNRALFRMHGLLQRCAAEFHIGAEIEVATLPARDGADVEMRYRG